MSVAYTDEEYIEERPQNSRKLDGDLTDLNEYFVVDIPMSAPVCPSCRKVIAILIAITFRQEYLMYVDNNGLRTHAKEVVQ